MKSERQIEFDFRHAINQAEELEDLAQRLRRLASRKLGEIEQTLPSYWDGPSAKSFQGKTFVMKNNLLKTAKDLEDEAKTIRNIARRIYQAEMEALAIARRRAAAAAAAARNAAGGGGGGGGGGAF